ncbi:MAG: hypothetical protein V1709_00725 [Planctomycetota bacterium]
MADENKIEVIMSIINQMSGQLQSIGNDFTKFKVSTEQNGKQIAQSTNLAVKAFLGFVGIPVTIMAVSAAIKKLSLETLGYGKEVTKLAYSLDVTNEQAQLLKRISTLLNVDMNMLETSFFKLSTELQSLREGTTDAIVKFDRFGISTQDLKNGNINLFQAFTKIVDYLGKMENAQERNTIAVDLFGKGGRQLSEVFDAAGGSFGKYLSNVKEGTKILSDAQIKMLKDTEQAYNKFWDDLMAGWREFFVDVVSIGTEAERSWTQNIGEKKITSIMTQAKGDIVILRKLLLELKEEGGLTSNPIMQKRLQEELDALKKLETPKSKTPKPPDKTDAEKAQELTNILKDKLSKAEFEAGGNTEVLRQKLEAMRKETGQTADSIKDIDAKLRDLTAAEYGQKFGEGWKVAMNHMRDASVDWGKSFIKIVDDIRGAFSDAFYSIGEMLISHTNSWKQIFRKFYQDIGGSIGRELSNAMGKNITAQLGSMVGAGSVTGAESVGAMAGIATNPITLVVAGIATLVDATNTANKRASESHKAQINYYQNMAANYREQGRILAEELAKKVMETIATAEGGRGIEDVMASSLKTTNATLKGLIAAADAMEQSAINVSKKKVKKKTLFNW